MNDTIHQAINICIKKNIPFVAYILPNQSNWDFFSNPSTNINCNTKFIINTFEQHFANPLEINAELNAIETIKLLKDSEIFPYAKITPWDKSTDFCYYNASLNNLISTLKENGGKVVISRTICNSALNFNWAKISEEYFKCFPSTFRYIYFTQETGCWLGASPEILIDYNANDTTFTTMSLAGTRKANNQPWDNKNIEEHDYVTEYIHKTLNSMGLKVTIHQAKNLSFGDIEHLCHIITSTFEPYHFIDILKRLSPTPALAGYPMDSALKSISCIEEHPRYCYGGYVALSNKLGFKAYVNFRGVHFNQYNYCIYSGGGITAKSNIHEEWAETESKIKKLKDIIDKFTS